MTVTDKIKTHEQHYKENAWRDYAPNELGDWVHLLLKRASHRADPEKRKKDLYDARNYLSMLEAHVESAENG